MSKVSYFGGNIADYPNAKRYYADGEPRPIKISITSFEGVLSGACHYYASVKEDFNPIWDGLHWRQCWDDEDGKGRMYEKRFNNKEDAQRWVQLIIAKNFPESPIRQTYENQFDWLPKEWFER